MPPDSDSPPLVLIVDDNEDARYMYGHVLEQRGLRVATATNGREAIQIARQLKPAVIVMDVSMPELDGLAATRALKADPANRDVCIIVLTAFALKETERQAFEAGCDRFLVKPVMPDKLVDVIDEVLRLR